LPHLHLPCQVILPFSFQLILWGDGGLQQLLSSLHYPCQHLVTRSTVSLCRESFPWPICIRQAMTDDVIGTSTEKHCTEDLFPVREVTIASEISKASEGARGFFPTRTNISRTWWISGEDRPSKVSRELIQRTMVDLEPEKSVSLDQFLDSGHFF